jgi:single-strand DNA-binding protein
MRCYIELLGRIDRDPEIHRRADDRFAVLNLATEETWHDRASGEQRTRSTWHIVRVTKAGVVKAIERELRAGALVFVAGSLRYSDWTDGQGTVRRTAEVVVRAPEHQLIFLHPASG